MAASSEQNVQSSIFPLAAFAGRSAAVFRLSTRVLALNQVLVSLPGLGLSRWSQVVLGLAVGATSLGCKERQEKSLPVQALTIGGQGFEQGKFVEPRALAASADGKLFVVDRTGRVQRFSADGNFETAWEMPDNSPDKGKSSGICVDAFGRVLVADTHFSRIVAFDHQGHELFRFGERGTGPGQFLLPTDVAVDSQGNFYVSEYGGNDRVSKFDPDREFLLDFGGIVDGSGSLQTPAAVAVDARDNVWVADSSNHRLCKFDQTGQLLQVVGRFGNGDGELRYPKDLVHLSEDAIVAVDYENNRVVYFGADGRPCGSWGHSGRGEGQLFLPLNGAVIGRTLYIADTKNHRLVGVQIDLTKSETIATLKPTGHQRGESEGL